MTKKDIARTISEKLDITQQQAKEIVETTLGVLVDVLVEERRIELRNFGVFEVRKRKGRKARNPRTGKNVFVGEKFVVSFKAGKAMEETLQQLLQKKTDK